MRAVQKPVSESLELDTGGRAGEGFYSIGGKRAGRGQPLKG